MNPGFGLIQCHWKLDSLAVSLINICSLFSYQGDRQFDSVTFEGGTCVNLGFSQFSKEQSWELFNPKKTPKTLCQDILFCREVRNQDSALVEKGSFHKAPAVEGSMWPCQQPERNSPVMRAMSHTCPCCSSPQMWGHACGLGCVRRKDLAESPLLHNLLSCPEHAAPRAGSCCRCHGLQNPFAADISFLSSFSLTLCSSGKARVTQSAPEQSQYCSKSHAIKKGVLAWVLVV